MQSSSLSFCTGRRTSLLPQPLFRYPVLDVIPRFIILDFLEVFAFLQSFLCNPGTAFG
jgi:hypothetical protein